MFDVCVCVCCCVLQQSWKPLTYLTLGSPGHLLQTFISSKFARSHCSSGTRTRLMRPCVFRAAGGVWGSGFGARTCQESPVSVTLSWISEFLFFFFSHDTSGWGISTWGESVAFTTAQICLFRFINEKLHVSALCIELFHGLTVNLDRNATFCFVFFCCF